MKADKEFESIGKRAAGSVCVPKNLLIAVTVRRGRITFIKIKQ